jgi:hypothetical protein
MGNGLTTLLRKFFWEETHKTQYALISLEKYVQCMRKELGLDIEKLQKMYEALVLKSGIGVGIQPE